MMNTISNANRQDGERHPWAPLARSGGTQPSRLVDNQHDLSLRKVIGKRSQWSEPYAGHRARERPVGRLDTAMKPPHPPWRTPSTWSWPGAGASRAPPLSGRQRPTGTVRQLLPVPVRMCNGWRVYNVERYTGRNYLGSARGVKGTTLGERAWPKKGSPNPASTVLRRL